MKSTREPPMNTVSDTIERQIDIDATAWSSETA